MNHLYSAPTPRLRPASSLPLRDMRIAFVRHTMRGRGSDVVADYIASRLAEGGAVVHMYHARKGFAPLFVPRHSDYVAFKLSSRAGFLLESCWRKFARADYVITDFAPILWALAHRNCDRLIYLAQGDDSALYEHAITKRMVNCALRVALTQKAIPVLCTGANCAETLRREFNARVTQIREGEWFRLLAFAAQTHAGSPPKRIRRFVVLAIVSKTYAKGPDVCFRALRALGPPLSREIEVWLAGDDLRWNLPGLVVRHFGRLSPARLALLYAAADAFLFTSRSENFPSPPFEAMTQGCAVVSTFADGYLRPHENCIAASPNSPDEIAESIQRILTDSVLRNALIAGGLATVQEAQARFEGVTTVVEDFIECISDRR